MINLHKMSANSEIFTISNSIRKNMHLALTPFQLGKIEEYKALRAEILTLINRQSTNLNMETVGTTALIYASFAYEKGPLLAVLSIFFAGVFWNRAIMQTDAICRIGAYIATHIEPFIPGIQWESQGKAATQSLLVSDKIKIVSTHNIVCNISVVCACFLLCKYYWNGNEDGWFYYIYMVISLILLGYGSIYVQRIRLKNKEMSLQWDLYRIVEKSAE